MQDDGVLLYRRFLNGDEGGLEELITLYQRGLFRFIYGYVRDEGLAEDIMQDVFVELYYKRNFQEKENASLKTYLYTVARNKSLNVIKKRKRKKEVSLDALMEKGETPASSDDALSLDAQEALYALSTDEQIESAENAKALHTAIGNVKEEYREVLLLRYFENLSPERIAQITKRKPKQVYNLLARGRAALKEELKKGGVDNEDV